MHSNKKGGPNRSGAAFDFWKESYRLFHQESSAGALDLTSDFAVQMCCQSCHATGEDFAALGGEFLEQIGVLEINRLGGDVKPTTRHHAVGAAEI